VLPKDGTVRDIVVPLSVLTAAAAVLLLAAAMLLHRRLVA
jgi:hypothetical protein